MVGKIVSVSSCLAAVLLSFATTYFYLRCNSLEQEIHTLRNQRESDLSKALVEHYESVLIEERSKRPEWAKLRKLLLEQLEREDGFQQEGESEAKDN